MELLPEPDVSHDTFTASSEITDQLLLADTAPVVGGHRKLTFFLFRTLSH